MINSTDVETLYNKGLALHDEQKYDEAIKYYDKALFKDPRYIIALNGKANSLLYMQKYDEALQYYDKAYLQIQHLLMH